MFYFTRGLQKLFQMEFNWTNTQLNQYIKSNIMFSMACKISETWAYLEGGLQVLQPSKLFLALLQINSPITD